MPASTGVSSCSTVRPILPRPSARSVPLCFWLWPMPERTWVILSFATLLLLLRGRLLRADRQDLLDREAARPGHVLGTAQRLQALDGRLRHVDRVRRAEAL